jgi:hypothetical protein
MYKTYNNYSKSFLILKQFDMKEEVNHILAFTSSNCQFIHFHAITFNITFKVKHIGGVMASILA